MIILFIILQSFSNPVWTVDQVGGIWIAIILGCGWLLYQLIKNFILAVKEISLFIKRTYDKIKRGY